jgi:hypothetical protein
MEIAQKVKRVRILQTIDDLSGNFLSYLRYISCKVMKKTYFGSYLAATQGKVNRHYYMQELVKHYCQTVKDNIRILEIGSWAGGSAITWADAIKKYSDNLGSVYCVDAWFNYIDSLSGNKSWVLKTMSKALDRNKIFYLFNYNISASGHSDIVFPLKVFSDDLLSLLKNKQFNLIFIDGNHLFEAAYKDISNAAPLVKDGGIICGDDLEVQYQDLAGGGNIEILNNVDVWTEPDSRKRFHPGVTLAVWKYFKCEVSCWDGFWAMKKNGDAWERILLKIDGNNFNIPKHFL